jgi:hypothetical protein
MITLVAVIFYSPISTSNYFLKPPTVAAADPPPSKEICTKTALYPLTFSPGKPEHTILCHIMSYHIMSPVGKSLQDANNRNIEFNKGYEAATNYLRTSTLTNISQLNCPSGHNKTWCSGWDFATQFARSHDNLKDVGMIGK